MTQDEKQELARRTADRETNVYIARHGFTPWQVAHETAIQNEIDSVWCGYLREALDDIELDEEAN